jgi:AcrR family transcriptional regulator
LFEVNMAPASTRAQQKARTRSQLLAAARDAFAAHGFEGTTIREIARRAGVATGTVFVHFPDKQGLLADVFQESLQAALDEAWRTLPPGPLADRLLHLAGRLYRFYAAEPALAQVLVKESLFMGGVPGRRLDDHRARFVARLEELIRLAGARDRPGAEAQDVAQAFFALYFSILIAGLRGELGDVPGWTEALRRVLRACTFATDGGPAGGRPA